MRPYQEIADLRRQVEILTGALKAAGVELPEYQTAHYEGLTPQECALIGILLRCYPRYMRVEDLIDLVRVIVCRIRYTMGHDAIETLPGRGYRLSPRLAKQ